MKLKVAYLDRDGTINEDRNYLSSSEDFMFCAKALEGMRAIQNLGLSLVVVTNQSGVARGYFDAETLKSIHNHMISLLSDEGIKIEGVYACLHGPEDHCACRKPLPGLIHMAEADLGRRPGVMIGDSMRDIQAGTSAGLRTILIAQNEKALPPCIPCDAVLPDLAGAAHWIRSFNEGN